MSRKSRKRHRRQQAAKHHKPSENGNMGRKFYTIPEIKNQAKNAKKWFSRHTEPDDVNNIFFPEGTKEKHYQVSKVDKQTQE